jgi:hypothetical protein
MQRAILGSLQPPQPLSGEKAMFQSIREKMFKSVNGKSGSKQGRPRRLAFEGLEHRQLLTAAVATSAALQTPVPTAAASTPALTIAQELNTAHILLAEANRDYNGHRAAANNEVTQAMKLLGYNPTSVPAPLSESQAASDAQLAAAQAILKTVLTQMGNSDANAALDVRQAVGEINLAFLVA